MISKPRYIHCTELLIFVPMLFIMAFCSPCCGGYLPEESVKEAFEEAGDFSWYDGETDSIRQGEVEASPPPEVPSDWIAQEKPKQTKTKRRWNISPAFWRVFEALIWIMVGAAIIGLVILAIYVISNRDNYDAQALPDSAHERRSDIDRVENLPFPVKRAQTDLLGEARRQYELGNYAEAVIYLFSYQLVQLDKYHLIRLTKGKTNGQYLAEIKNAQEIASLLVQTMVTFEDVFFGNLPLERQRFELSWNRLDEFHHLVEQQTAA